MSKRILFVDDEAEYRQESKPMLEAAGFSVVEAETGAAALEMIENEAFDLVITDLMMERADSGFTLAFHSKKLRPDMPIIIISSVNSEHGIHFSLETPAERAWIKADAFINKPFRAEQLMHEVQRLTGCLPCGCCH